MHNSQCITIGQLAEMPLDPGRYTRIMPCKHLKYDAPGVDGLGLVSVSLLVPESAVLFVAPPGCARHVAMRAYERGNNERLFLLRVSESELVAGTHLDKIPEAIEQILKEHGSWLKALSICSSCVDTVLASDYETLAKKMEARFGIRVRASYMDPIMFDHQKSPDNRIQSSVYSFIEPDGQKDNGVNLIGGFRLPPEQCELFQFLKDGGIVPVRHISQSGNLGEMDEMSRSQLNIVLNPPAKHAAVEMKKKLGIPTLMMPVRYDPDRISDGYRSLEKALNITIADAPYKAAAEEKLRQGAALLKNKHIAIGKSIRGNIFELARILGSYGYHIDVLIKNKITPNDVENIRWLAENMPHIQVYPGDHPTQIYMRDNHEPLDIAIGADAAYFYPEAEAIRFPSGKEVFGYHGIISLVQELIQAAEEGEHK